MKFFQTGIRSVDELLSIAVYARERVNPLLFNYALSVAIFHRADTKDLNLPTMVELFPEKFVDSRVIGNIREEADVVRDEQRRIPIIIPRDYTASDREPEHRQVFTSAVDLMIIIMDVDFIWYKREILFQ